MSFEENKQSVNPNQPKNLAEPKSPRVLRHSRREFNKNKEFEEKVIQIKRVSKTTKGGRTMRFSALVVVGDRRGQVGFGVGKALEVPDAIKKAVKNALKNLIRVRINKRGTLFQEVYGRHGAGKVLLKPAKLGIGIIAGGSIRSVVELAGFTDIYSKNLGKNTKINMVRAAINGLISQRTPLEIARLRDKKLRDL